jgi:hypothetical protein
MITVPTPTSHETVGWGVEGQEEFLTAALEGYSRDSQPTPFNIKSGENAEEFREFVGYQDWLLAADFADRGYKISDAQRPAVLDSHGYQSPSIQNLSVKYNLSYCREEWSKKLKKFGATLYELSMIGGNINEGLLSCPPYAYQGEEIDKVTSAAVRSCNAANFRMVFGGITGEKLSEKVLNRVKNLKHGQEVAPMEFYAGILKSEHFKQRYSKKIDMFDTYGASLSDISKVAKVVKAKGGEAYCVAALSSRIITATGHRVVILSADDKDVVCHDPAVSGGGEAIKIPRKKFAERWAGGYNRTFLFVSRDIPQADLRPVE